MSKMYYSDYVAHCMRFYTRTPKPVFATDTDRLDWESCKSVLATLDVFDITLLTNIHKERDTLADNVYQACKGLEVSQDYAWSLIQEFERKVAVERGLISEFK